MTPTKISILLACILFSNLSNAADDHYVRGYTKKDGTYVAPHHQTNSNQTKSDNYSTSGNVNPYTGKTGSKKN